MSELIPKRPLASLTKEECQTLFALAFGFAPPLEQLFIFSICGPLTIRFQGNNLVLYSTGLLLVMDHEDYAVPFNARKLLTQLDTYNVAFGDDFITKPLNESGS